MLLPSHYARLREVARGLSNVDGHGNYEADLLLELVREAEARDYPNDEQRLTSELVAARDALAQIATFARQQKIRDPFRKSQTTPALWEHVEHLARTALQQAPERAQQIALTRARLESGQRRLAEIDRDASASNIRDIIEKAEQLHARTVARRARVEQHFARRPRHWLWRSR